MKPKTSREINREMTRVVERNNSGWLPKFEARLVVLAKQPRHASERNVCMKSVVELKQFVDDNIHSRGSLRGACSTASMCSETRFTQGRLPNVPRMIHWESRGLIRITDRGSLADRT